MKKLETYSHYFYRKEKLPKAAWKAFLADVFVLCGLPEFSDDIELDASETSLRLNGFKKKSEYLTILRDERITGNRIYRDSKRPDRIFSSVRTGQLPYDTVVTAILILAKIHFQDDIRIISDGGAVGFVDGLEAVKQHFPHYGDIEISDGDMQIDFCIAPKKVATTIQTVAPMTLEEKLKADQQARFEKFGEVKPTAPTVLQPKKQIIA